MQGSNTKPRCRNLSGVTGPHTHGNLVLGNGVVHLGNHTEMIGIHGLLQTEEPAKPAVGDAAFYRKTGIRIVGFRQAGQIRSHDGGMMFDAVTALLEQMIEIRIPVRGYLENGGSVPTPVYGLAFRNFGFRGQHRISDLFDAVCTVGIKIGKTQYPAVIELNLMGRPRIERQILNFFLFAQKNRLFCPYSTDTAAGAFFQFNGVYFAYIRLS